MTKITDYLHLRFIFSVIVVGISSIGPLKEIIPYLAHFSENGQEEEWNRRREANHDANDDLHDGHDDNANDGEPAPPGIHSLVLGPRHHETLDSANLRLQVNY